jgi:hypothetical protein
MSFMQKQLRMHKLPMCDLRQMRDPQAVVEVVLPCFQTMLAQEGNH